MTRNGGERKAQQPRSVSLADVARRAGVSVATASRVASGSSYAVSPERFERVEKAILELGYTPNVLARALARDESLAIGVIVGDITDPYFGEVTRGIEDYARRAGYLTILCNADRNASVEKAYVDMLRQQRAAGIVLAGGGFVDQAQQVGLAACVEQAVGEGARVIAIADRALDGVPVISVDNEAMLADLTDYVASLGHERIAFVAAPPGFTTGDQRLAGFQFSMRRLRLDPTLIYAGGFDYAWGRRAALRILKDGLPDAIIAFNRRRRRHAGRAIRWPDLGCGADV